MTESNISDAQLRRYLEDALSEEEMISLERSLREQNDLRLRLERLIAQHGSGVHSLGDVWGRNRLSCPTREMLGSYLFGVLSDDAARFVELHLQVTACAECRSNFEDLKTLQADDDGARAPRRQRYFQSSVGRLRKEKR